MEIRKKEMSDESGLDELFGRYRQSCPDVEPSAHFMPALWRKIEVRHSFPILFRQWGRSFVTVSAALCLLLLVLNLAVTPPQIGVSYTDALMAETSAEQTYYTEALRNAPSPDVFPTPLR